SDRWSEAREILLQWAGLVSQGMLPNRFSDHGDQAAFNSVDASLWFVVAAGEYLSLGRSVASESSRLREAIEAILGGYHDGTRFGIGADDDGLLRAGEPGHSLTWMDAIVSGTPVTPRIGKPVEIQALWLNALAIGSHISPHWAPILDRGRRSFVERFWNGEREHLYDVVDCDHVAARLDPSLRPNQIFAVGGLPLVLVGPEMARKIVDAVEAHLLTPFGLRTLGPEEPGYVGQYAGGVAERDGCYHQGTVWPWLMGAFVEAWLRVRDHSEAAKKEAVERFVLPFLEQRNQAGLGHISEIADGDAPHTPRGCPFQAWSLGELLRLDRLL
ncbi:MAG: amylo-alpha-1,6-glucosidase, partial [Chthoniobacterales bacterium]